MDSVAVQARGRTLRSARNSGGGMGHTYGMRGGMSSIALKRPVHSRIFLSNWEGLCSAGTL